jgi:hypothetical protein
MKQPQQILTAPLQRIVQITELRISMTQNNMSLLMDNTSSLHLTFQAATSVDLAQA